MQWRKVMKIDDELKNALTNEAKQLDQKLAHQPGIFKLLANAYAGALGRWMMIVTLVALIVTLVMLYSGYQFFFIEGSIMFKLHWAVILLLSSMVQIALKIWAFMEMNRQSVLRETKRVELALEQLQNKIS